MNNELSILNCSNLNYLTGFIVFSAGDIFFSRFMQILETKDLGRLSLSCATVASMPRLKKCLFDRKVDYENQQIELFQKISNDIMPVRIGSSAPFDPVFLFIQYQGVLSRMFSHEHCIYSISLITGLSRVIESRLRIDPLIIYFLNAFSKIINWDVRKCFLKKLCWLNDFAIAYNMDGFDLLKQFTISVLTSLSKFDRKYLQVVLTEMQFQLVNFISADFDNGTIFRVYRDFLPPLKSTVKKIPKKDNCIIA